MPDKPSSYEGQPVIKIAVKVTNAGDGLSNSMNADGLALHMGQEVDVVLGNCVVSGVDLRPIDKDDPSGPLVANYVLKAGQRATITDDANVKGLLAAQEARVRAVKGEEQIPGLEAGAGPDAETVERVVAADVAAEDEYVVSSAPAAGDDYYDPESPDVQAVKAEAPA